MFLKNNKIRSLITRSWLVQTLYLLSLLTIKAPTHTDTHNGVNSFTLKHTYTERDTKRDRERVTERMSGEEKVVCVTGASGYIASWLVKHLLQRGCTVKATVRDISQCLSLSPICINLLLWTETAYSFLIFLFG